MKAIKISDNVYWVGAIDWGVRNFHGYTTNKGTTYNAYLIMGEKITLIDTVKYGFRKELLSRISSVIDPEKIDYIVSNHAEPDHSGALPEVIKTVKPEKVFASKMGVKALVNYYPGLEVAAVDNNSELSLGNLTLKFMETRMLHWPDSMFTYLVEDKVLFSQDAFGMHMASTERFDTDFEWNLLEKQAADYYANIIILYSTYILKLLDKVASSGLEFKYVAPDHGPIWRDMEMFGKLFNLYRSWAQRKLERKVVIIYDTMWKSTEKMARYIEDGIRRSGGVKVQTMPLASCSRSEVADELLDAAAIVVGAPTLNNNIYPSVADVLTYVKGLKFNTPISAAFGSYGWSGESIRQIKEYLSSMKTELVGEVSTKYSPCDETKEKCYLLGETVANNVKGIVNQI